MRNPRKDETGRHRAPQLPNGVVAILSVDEMSPAEHAQAVSELAAYVAKLTMFAGQIRRRGVERAIETKERVHRVQGKNAAGEEKQGAFADRTRWLQNEFSQTGLRERIIRLADAFYRLQIPPSTAVCDLLSLLDEPRERHNSDRLAVARQRALIAAAQASKEGKSLRSQALAKMTKISRETMRRWVNDPEWNDTVKAIASTIDEPPKLFAGPIRIKSLSATRVVRAAERPSKSSTDGRRKT